MKKYAFNILEILEEKKYKTSDKFFVPKDSQTWDGEHKRWITFFYHLHSEETLL